MNYSSTQFHWMNPKTVYADASELGVPPGVSPCGQLYPDACDMCIKVRSSKHPQEVTIWYLTNMAAAGWFFRADARIALESSWGKRAPTNLAREQTIENLQLFSDRLQKAYEILKKRKER